jgi:hypothetical protein
MRIDRREVMRTARAAALGLALAALLERLALSPVRSRSRRGPHRTGPTPR